MATVVGILEGLELGGIPRLVVYNKADLLSAEARADLGEGPDHVLVSAVTGEGSDALVSRIGEKLRESGKRYEAAFSGSR
jgi:50S ribosomal subunit-associated GTPase HflX